jgi:hypothetical protein
MRTCGFLTSVLSATSGRVWSIAIDDVGGRGVADVSIGLQGATIWDLRARGRAVSEFYRLCYTTGGEAGIHSDHSKGDERQARR